MADWSSLPEELLNLIAVRLFSIVELIRFRSICSSWRSSVSNPSPSRPLIHLIPSKKRHIHNGEFLSRSAFFRVTLSSSSSSHSSQGWLIKTKVDIDSGKLCLLHPLSGASMRHSCESLDLLEFTISEIQETYKVLDWQTRKERSRHRFKRVILVKDERGGQRVLGLRCDGKIKYWKGRHWKVEKLGYKFSDIIVHKGLTYALDSTGIVLWISSKLEVCSYGPPLGDNITNGCSGERTFVDSCGKVYIVDRLFQENNRKRKADFLFTGASFLYTETVGFKVYKFDEELGKMIEVKSLGDKAFVMTEDTCVSVLAHEFYGCLENSIYFTEKRQIKVFKLDNGNGSSSIATMSKFPQACFQMFVPSFL